MSEIAEQSLNDTVKSFQKEIIKGMYGANPNEFGITQIHVYGIPMNLILSRVEANTYYVYLPFQNQVIAKTQNKIDYYWLANINWDDLLEV